MEDDFMGDEELQMLTQKYEMGHPYLECPSRRETVELCTNKRCKLPSFLCRDELCPECPKHSTCSSIKLSIITKMLREIADSEREFLMRMYEIQDLAVKNIQRNRREQLEKQKFSSLSGRFGEIIETIYFKGKQMLLIGQEVDELIYAINDKQLVLEEVKKPLLQNFRKEMQGLVSSIDLGLKQKIDQFCVAHHKKEFELEKELPKQLKLKGPKNELQVQKYRQMNILQNSKVIDKDNSAFIKIIHENILEPTQLELIFRASQANFSAKAFHKAVHDVEFTLTLYKTEFGNTLAGFAPNSWNSSVGWSPDPTYSSFILSLDLMERMELKAEEKATFCHEDWGPCFGDDLTVGDRCDVKMSCETIFPSCYRSNLKQLAYSTQDVFRKMFGVIKGNKFRMAEYEVYRVEW